MKFAQCSCPARRLIGSDERTCRPCAELTCAARLATRARETLGEWRAMLLALTGHN